MGWIKVVWAEYRRIANLFFEVLCSVAEDLPDLLVRMFVLVFILLTGIWLNPMVLLYFYVKARIQFPSALKAVRAVKHENIYMHRKAVHSIADRFPNERRFQILKRAVDAKIKRQGLTNLI